MAVTSIKGHGALTSNGAYAGTLTGRENVLLASKGMNVDLSRIENVNGSSGNDIVKLGGELVRGTGKLRLDDGTDTLHLSSARTYKLSLDSVEIVTGVAGSTLDLGRKGGSFQTDGSVNITALTRSAELDITFTDLVNNTRLVLQPDSDATIRFGAGFSFNVNADGELVAVKNGHTLSFADQSPANNSLELVVNGQGTTYARLLSSDSIDTDAPAVSNVVPSTTVVNDASAGAAAFSIVVSFDSPMLADGSANPVLSFDHDVAGSLALTGQAWNAAGTAFTATYAVTDAGVDVSAIKVGVSGAKDLALNAQAAYTAQVEFAIDTLNPSVTITEDNADGTVSDADNVVAYSVSFSQPVAALAAEHLEIAGGTLVGAPVLAAGGLSATFSVTAADDSTTDVVVGLKNTIVDAHGNALVVPTPVTLAVDTVNPTVASLALQAPAAQFTNADTLVWRVSFGDTVSQVDAADFTVTGTTATVTDVAVVSGGAYDVTVSGGDLATLDGDVTLAFAAGQDIVDAAGNALANTTPSGVNQPTFTVDNTAPTVALGPVDGITTNATGYVFTGTGIATLNGAGDDANPVTTAQIDWSKLWIEVDGGSEHDITFTAADIASIDPTGGSFDIVLTAGKIASIDTSVDGSNDLIVVDQGFWGDLAGNVQLVGGNYSATAGDLTPPAP